MPHLFPHVWLFDAADHIVFSRAAFRLRLYNAVLVYWLPRLLPTLAAPVAYLPHLPAYLPPRHTSHRTTYLYCRCAYGAHFLRLRGFAVTAPPAIAYHLLVTARWRPATRTCHYSPLPAAARFLLLHLTTANCLLPRLPAYYTTLRFRSPPTCLPAGCVRDGRGATVCLVTAVRLRPDGCLPPPPQRW